MTRHLALILDGRRAHDEAIRLGVTALRQDGHQVSVRVTWEGGQVDELVAEVLGRKPDVLVACGGDGMVNAVAAALANVAEAPAMAIVPLGTANDFACAAGIPLDPQQALRLAAKAPARAVDLGALGERVFVNLASAGFASEITQETPDELKRLLGSAAYLVSGLTRFGAVHGAPARVRSAGFEWSGSFLVLAVGNGPQAGGGHRLCPDARIDDGLLDLCILPDPPEGERLATLARLMSDGLVGVQDRLVIHRAANYHVSTDAPVSVNLDGEPMQGTELRFSVRAESLTLILPPDCPLVA